MELNEMAYLLGYEDASSFSGRSTIGKGLRPDNGENFERTYNRLRKHILACREVGRDVSDRLPGLPSPAAFTGMIQRTGP
jgi:hypothetical protein